MEGAAELVVLVIAGFQGGGGLAEEGDRVVAAGVAEQGVEGHSGGQACGERPASAAGHLAIVPRAAVFSA